uniref:PLA2c domain-containing protein n=1 Tax=Knipowitschia caucasica TaxID=637954 RepID=A0AAV2JLZ1_KNICA
MGIWSSVFSLNLSSLWKAMTGSAPEWTPDHTNVANIEKDLDPSTLDTLLLSPESGLGSSFSGFFKNRPIINETFNFTRGLSLHQHYSRSSYFLSWRDSHPDAFPNQMTPSDNTLHLIDSGHHINLGCPPILRPERHTDLIIVLSYSWDPSNVFKVLEKTQEYCKDRNIPFPCPDYEELRKQPLREVYVFEDQEKPTAPMVLFLPLVNMSYQEFKRPGIVRSQEELAAGRVDVSSPNSPYKTKNMTYSEEDYDALIDLTTYNVLHSKDTILSALSTVMTRKQGSP